MRFEFKPSFKRSIKYFQDKEREEIKKIAILTIGILSGSKDIHKGLGLKRSKIITGKYVKGSKQGYCSAGAEILSNLSSLEIMTILSDF